MLVIDEDLLKLDQLVDDLVELILQSPTSQNYQSAKASFLADKILQEQLQELNENLEYLPFRPELRQLEKNINLNEKVYHLRLAENDLQTILSEITEKIAASISPSIDVNENLPLRKGKKHKKHGRI